jgi:FkbH-like protein
MSGARGVHIETRLAAFDSVEQSILDPQSPIYASPADVVILLLSGHWLARYLGSDALIPRVNIDRTRDVLTSFLSRLTDLSASMIVVGTFPASTASLPGGQVTTAELVGWNTARHEINLWLGSAGFARTVVVDVDDAVTEAGGRDALGGASYLRAKIPFEPRGCCAVARELASVLAHVAGKSTRAIVADWDNTLWGGEIAELGPENIVCGHDGADALGYLQLQHYLAALKPLGILLAGVSRNDPAIRDAYATRRDLPLGVDDFASLQIGFGPKSAAIEQVAEDLGFGPEHMLLVDDSVFEIAEVLTRHPDIDVVLAGPSPDITLRNLSASRLFNIATVSEADLQRSARAHVLRRQRDVKAAAASLDDFLDQIDIRLAIERLTDANITRVAQLFQKTNQFNLATRRHNESDLRRLVSDGANIGVLSYLDAFGSQGIVGAVVLVEQSDGVRIESWLMSCRVLNRTLEQATFEWIVGQAGTRAILGEYRMTEKNRLVRDLYRTLGFTPAGTEAGSDWWRLAPGPHLVPSHHVTMTGVPT